MSKSSEAVKDWRRRTKQKIIEAMGGKCVLCGYDKLQEVFDLHHMIPDKKTFSFASVRANPIAWHKIVNELRNCVLLCANCHREVTAGYQTVPPGQYFNEAYAATSALDRNTTTTNQFSEYKKSYKIRKCKVCNSEFVPVTGNQRKCNELCTVGMSG